MNSIYDHYILEAKSVMETLMKILQKVEDMKLFKNVMAVYSVWQQELYNIQLAEAEWLTRKQK